MTALLAAAGVAAVADWSAVAGRQKGAEYVFKPLTLVLLIWATLVLDPRLDQRRAWFVAALVLSLAGDVFLMLRTDFFIAGLAVFLMAHLAYIGGFFVDAPGAAALSAGAGMVALPLAVLGRRIARGAPPGVRLPIWSYMVVLSAMLAVAVATENVLAAAGAILFYVSDALIGWRRFVSARRWMPVATIVTYHLAQANLVLSLLH